MRVHRMRRHLPIRYERRSMYRRPLLASLAVLVAGVPGCLGDADESADPETATDANDEPSVPAPADYEQCPRLVVDVQTLPEPAREEVRAALADGTYETSDEPSLPHVLDPAESYLQAEDGTYRVDLARDGETTRIELVEAVPSKGRHDFEVRNESGGSLTVDLAITWVEGEEQVVEDTVELGPDERRTVAEYDRKLGQYRTNVESDSFSKTLTWREEEHVEPFETLVVDGGDAYPEPRAVAELVQCSSIWED